MRKKTQTFSISFEFLLLVKIWLTNLNSQYLATSDDDNVSVNKPYE